jgi:hypothetical protein
MMGASVVPILIFVQKGNPWNVIQFFYYFLFFAGLYAANAVKKFPTAVLVLIVLITPISSLATFHGWFNPTPPAYISTGEFAALNFLSKTPEGTVLKHPFDESLRGKFKDPYIIPVYVDSAYVSAYSGKSVYIEDAEQQIVLDTNYKTRLENVKRFFVEKDLTWSAKFLKDNNIRYIYLPKIYQLPMAEGEYPMRKIFENDDAKIYMIR